VKKEVSIKYNGTEYSKFFEYPNPIKQTHDFDPRIIEEMSDYSTCKAYTSWNPKMYFQEVAPYRGFSVHICFEKCKTKTDSDDPNFELDDRDVCDEDKKISQNDGILCVHPQENECDVLLLKA
jgi:hypothetical protein